VACSEIVVSAKDRIVTLKCELEIKFHSNEENKDDNDIAHEVLNALT
jgi:hypothetical protein